MTIGSSLVAGLTFSRSSTTIRSAVRLPMPGTACRRAVSPEATAESSSRGGPPRELLGAVAGGDTARLQAVPGIGKRTAERIVVELREKVGVPTTEDPIVITRGDDPRSLAREALLGLGYTPQETDGLLREVTGDTPEDLIAAALREARR